MRNLILTFLIIIFSISSAYADTENRIKRPPFRSSDTDVIKYMKKHNPDKRFFRRVRILSRQVRHKRKPIVQDDANIYFIPGSIALAAIAYLTPKEIWQHLFIRVRNHNSKHNYIIGIQIKF